MADISTIKFENTVYNIKDNNALHSTDLPLPINKGGTNATSNTTAIKNLFPNELTSSSTNYFLTIDSKNYNKVGISSTTNLKNSLGLGVGNNVVFKSLNVTSTADANSTVNNSVALIIGNPNGEHIEIDTNEIVGKSSATTGHTLAFNFDNDSPCYFGPGGIKLLANSKLFFNDATGYIEYYDAAAYKTNQYGNFIHKRNTATDTFSICNNAETATFKVQYESGTITAGKWNGTIIDTAYGGTGNTTGLAASATKLATGRNIQTDLAKTSAVSFNGTAAIEPGVKGILSVANGGTGVNTLASGQLLMGNGANDVSTTTITKLSALSAITSDNGIISNSALRRWNGAYNSSTNASNLTKLGTITNGVWQGTVIGTSYGGTGGNFTNTRLTNNSTFTYDTNNSNYGLFIYKLGKLVYLVGRALKLATALSAGASRTLYSGLGAVNSVNYKPPRTTKLNIGYHNVAYFESCYGYVSDNGSIVIYAPKTVNLSANQLFDITACWIQG